MNLFFLPLAIIPAIVLSSCSTIEQTLAELRSDPLSKETISSSASEIGSAKPDSSRLSSAAATNKEVLISSRTQPASKTSLNSKKRSSKPTALLVKNTPATKQTTAPSSISTPSKAPSPPTKLVAKTTPEKQLPKIPPLELPPLPKASSERSSGFTGILPSLNEGNETTSIAVDGETPLLTTFGFGAE